LKPLEKVELFQNDIPQVLDVLDGVQGRRERLEINERSLKDVKNALQVAVVDD